MGPLKKKGDFEKKKIKVGKTIKKANVTKITMQSKKINIPTQSHITTNTQESEKDTIDKLLRQFHHYNSSMKVNALEECKNFLANMKDISPYIAIIVPTAMELLYDEDQNCREALLSFMNFVLKSCKSISFQSIISVIITYTCSGLTSLGKVISYI